MPNLPQREEIVSIDDSISPAATPTMQWREAETVHLRDPED